MIKNKILVPLDASIVSRKILIPVRQFFPPDQASLLLLQVLHPHLQQIKIPPAHAIHEWTPTMYQYFEKLQMIEHDDHVRRQEQLKLSAQESLEVDAQEYRKLGYEVSTMAVFGDPTEQIEAVIRQKGINLVAMTTHAREGFGRLLFGSVSGQLIHDITTIPVMLLHPSSNSPA